MNIVLYAPQQSEVIERRGYSVQAMWLELIRVDACILVRPTVLRTEGLGWAIFGKVEIYDVAPANQCKHACVNQGYLRYIIRTLINLTLTK